MKNATCPECGRRVRPSNLSRHRRARHMPRPRACNWGTRFTQPALPIRIAAWDDRRYDEVAPRGEGPARYRIYRLRAGELELVGYTGTACEMGEALVDLHDKGEFIVDDSVGCLDTKTDPGHWIVHPFALGRRKLPEEAYA